MRRLAAGLGAIALLACHAEPAGGGARADARSGPAPRVEIGTGELAFAEIPESGGTLELVHGPQGGYHVVVAVRVWDLVPDRLSLVYEVERASGGRLARVPFILDAGRLVVEGDHLVRYGDLAIFDIAAPAEIVGQDVIVRATATAADGASASDERRARIVDETM